MAAADANINALARTFEDAMTRALQNVMRQLRNIQGETDRAGSSMRKMGDGVRNAGKQQVGLREMAKPVAAVTAELAPLMAVGAAVAKLVEAFNPAIVERFGAVLHDMAGTIGQVLYPVFAIAVDITRRLADVFAGLMDAFNPIVSALTSALLPILEKVFSAWVNVAQTVAAIFLPVIEQVAVVIQIWAGILAELYQILMPFSLAFGKIYATIYGVMAGIMQAILPVVGVVVQVFGVIATVLSEMLNLVVDVVREIVGAIGEMFSPLRDLYASVGQLLVEGIKTAVTWIKELFGTIRGMLGLKNPTAIAAADSRGRGYINQTGTENATATFARIQEAVLKAGGPKTDEEKHEEKQTSYLENLDRHIKEIRDWVDTWLNKGRQILDSDPVRFAEGALNSGAFGLGGQAVGFGIGGARGLLK